MSNTLMRFLLTGSVATLLQYATLWFGVEVLYFPAVIASGSGYLAGSAVSYAMNYYFTFNSNRSHVGAAARFYLMVGVGWLINIVVVGGLADLLQLNKWVAQLIATTLALIWNYYFSRNWVFKSV